MSRRNVIPITASRRDLAASPMDRGLLPWEDLQDFQSHRAAFHQEHLAKGPTEASLVDQLVWLDWRRRRLVVGERSAHMAALQDRLSTEHKSGETLRRAMIESGGRAEKDELVPALSTLPDEDRETLEDTNSDEAMTRRAIAILETGDPDAYGEALAAMRHDTADWWEDVVGDDEQTHPDGKQHADDCYKPYARNREQLLRFLNTETMSMHKTTRGQLARRPAIRLQAQGESLDPFRMNLLLTLDERLTRQFEKTLAMLLKLQELRASRKTAP